MIKVIAFDYGGVIGWDADVWGKKTYEEFEKLTYLSEKEILKILEKHWPTLKIGKSNMKDFWKDIAERTKINPDRLAKLYIDSLRIRKDALDLTRKLSKKYELVIWSNETKDWMNAKIKKFKLNEIFAKIYNSADLGVGKPQKEFFDYALSDLKVKPSEVLFIDNQENNYKAAKKYGVRTILYKNLKQLKKELSNFPSD